jgi:hypothetical protein
MFITKKHVSRRTVLRGAGATLALPLLEAMVPAATALAQTAASPKPRFVGLFVCHGMAPGYWVPSTEGPLAAELPFIFKPLEPHRDHTVILSGLHSRSAEPPPGATGADHWVAAAFLCANKPRKTAGADVYAGTTIDQMIAQKIGQDSLMPSMQLTVEDPGANSSNCGEGYSCTYTNTISWATPTSPLPMELNPQVVFERMFGDGSTVEQRTARRKRDQSILDSLTGSLSRLRSGVSSADRARLDDYTENVREIERRLQIAMKASTVAPADLTVPVGVPQTFDEHIKLQFDLLALAFQADITRVATMMIAREGSTRTYPEIGVSDPHHPLTHHRNNAEWIEKVTQINEFHMGLFAKFIAKLAATPEGDGTLLDHSMIVYGSGIADGNRHTHLDLPVLLVGNGGGALAPGRHIRYAKDTPMTNLYMTLLDRMGVRPESVGDSTGKVQHLANV